MIVRSAIVAAATLLALSAPSSGRAAVPGCTVINAAPAVITTPGHYCLKNNVATANASGAAISIEAENVLLDCGGFLVNGLPAGAGTRAAGIRVARAHGTVRNCEVRGFEVGIETRNPSFPTPAALGVVIEDNQVHESTAVGIGALATGTVVRRNLVADTGGNPNNLGAEAIVGNFDAEIVDNLVDGVMAAPGGIGDFATGISAHRQAIVARNRVRNLVAATTTGLWIGGEFAEDDQAVLAHDNVVTMSGEGNAITCDGVVDVLRGNAVHGGVGVDCTLADGAATPAATQPLPAPTNCKLITSLPAVIGARGVYCLATTLSAPISSGNAITIAASDVTLDCLDHVLDGSSAGAGTAATGIGATQFSRITIRGCAVRGFRHGVRILQQAGAPDAPTGIVVEGNRIHANLQSGIVVQADAAAIRGNLVVQTGTPGAGTTLVTAIQARYATDVVDNRIAGIFGSAAIGIHSAYGTGGTIAGNRITGLEISPGATAIKVMGNSHHVFVIANALIAGSTSDLPVAIACNAPDNTVRGNTVLGYPIGAVSGCIDDGGNVEVRQPPF